MKTASQSLFCIVTFSCFNAFAQQCSGGAEGGMDATGNLCNAPSQQGGPTSGKTDVAEGGAGYLVKPMVISARVRTNENLRSTGGMVLIGALPDFKAKDLRN